jgi:hypothetical protein
MSAPGFFFVMARQTAGPRYPRARPAAAACMRRASSRSVPVCWQRAAMLGFVAAVIFVIAFLINAISTATSAVFSPTSLLLAGLACLALHVAGIGAKWSVAKHLTRR